MIYPHYNKERHSLQEREEEKWLGYPGMKRRPYTVTVSQSAPEVSPAPAASASEEEKPDSLLEGEVIDINSAPAEDLQRLPGIGEKRAQAIVAWRAEHGPFRSVDELVQVAGIGEKLLAGLRDYAAAGPVS